MTSREADDIRPVPPPTAGSSDPTVPRPADPPITAAALDALHEAIRTVATVLAVEKVLQLIVDRVRALVGARYAALGITHPDGHLERFITSGLTAAEREAIGAAPRGHGILGLIVREARTFRIADIATDPRRHGFPPNHPPMHAFLGVPITVRGRAMGNFYLTDKVSGPEFSEADQLLVEMFALHAGSAIENARLHEQVQRLAVVTERERIGRDLHDGIIQAIYGIGLSLEDVPDIMAADPGDASARIDRAIESLNVVIRDIRSFIFGLRPEDVEADGLIEGLATLVEESRYNTTIDIELSSEGVDGLELEPEARQQVLQIAREALSNVARHSGATRASVRLERDGTDLHLIVKDNGRGFDAAADRGPGHRGIVNMHSRVEGIGGSLAIDTAPGHGVRVVATVALPDDVPVGGRTGYPAPGGTDDGD